jgi:hypothetical protein
MVNKVVNFSHTNQWILPHDILYIVSEYSLDSDGISELMELL